MKNAIRNSFGNQTFAESRISANTSASPSMIGTWTTMYSATRPTPDVNAWSERPSL